jgi:hypothetical protein
MSSPHLASSGAIPADPNHPRSGCWRTEVSSPMKTGGSKTSHRAGHSIAPRDACRRHRPARDRGPNRPRRLAQGARIAHFPTTAAALRGSSCAGHRRGASQLAGAADSRSALEDRHATATARVECAHPPGGDLRAPLIRLSCLLSVLIASSASAVTMSWTPATYLPPPDE